MNLVTEKVAKGRECRVGGVPAFARDGLIQTGAVPTCSASKCMHWRWAEGDDRTKRGYCGLAGPAEVLLVKGTAERKTPPKG